jgi:DNA-binding GntR family transcriptional regulator
MSTSAKSGGGNGRRRVRSTTSGPRGRNSSDQAARVEELVQALEAGIATGSIAVNSWLRQETLAAEFNVSRTPVREALRMLQAKGMVELVPNRGALVRGPSSRDIREAYVLRAELEGFAAQLAADYIRDDELRQLREAEELFGRTVDNFISDPQQAAPGADAGARPTWMQANDLFHQSVQLGAGNARLKGAIEDLHRSFPRNLTWSALSGDSRLLSDNVKEHAAIRAAIEERDPAAARRLMTDHVLRSGELVVMWFERQADPR